MSSTVTSDRLRALFQWCIKQKSRWAILVAGIVGGYVLFIPSFSVLQNFGHYNEKRLIQIVLLIVVGGVLIVGKSFRRRWLRTFQVLPWTARLGLLFVLCLGVISSILAPVPFYAFLEVGHFVLLFAVALGIASVVRKASGGVHYGFLVVVTISAILYSVYFSVGYGMHIVMADIKLWPRAATNFANIRFFNQYQTWTLPFLPGAVLAVPWRWRIVRLLLFTVSSLWWTLVLASGGQATMVAVAGATVCVGLLFGSRAGKWLVVQAAAIFIGWVLFELMFSPEMVGSNASAGSPFGEQLSGDSRYGRLDHWAICLDLAWAHPWLGAGPMHYAWPPFNFEPAASPHSALMQWLGEWGVPSTATMTSLATWGGWSWIQQERQDAETASPRGNAIRISLVAAVLAGGAHAMVSGILVTPLSQMLLVLVGGWALGRYQPKNPDHSTCSHWGIAVFCTIIVWAMCVVGTSLKDLSTIEERRSAFRGAVDRGYYSPRYWTQGYIGVQDSSVIERAHRE